MDFTSLPCGRRRGWLPLAVVFILALATGCGPASFRPEQAEALPGEMYRADAAHSGVFPASDGAGQNAIEWTFSTGDIVHSSPAIANQTAYFGSFDSNLYAVDVKTGKARWTYQTGGAIYSSPAAAGSIIFFGSSDGKLYAIKDAHDEAELLWAFETNGSVMSSPAVVGDLVYAGSGDGSLYAVERKSGKLKWEFYTAGPVFSSPVVSGGVVYTGSGDGFLYAVDADTGAELWKAHTADWILSSPAVAGGTVFWGGYDMHLYAYNTGTHQALWKYQARGVIQSSPAAADNRVFFGSSDGYFYALEASTGAEVWKYRVDAEVYASPVVHDQMVYFAGLDGKLYAAEAATGRVVWQFDAGSPVMASPAIAGDHLYLAASSGELYALDLSEPGLEGVVLNPPTPPAELPQLPRPAAASPAGTGHPWWSDLVFYEVLVRSFYDTTADGAGDLPGLIEKLDYLNDGNPATNTDLGVDALVLLPLTEAGSPHGYDVIDYQNIQHDYGTLEDFHHLVEEAHQRGIKVIVDLPINQTSRDHPWFIADSRGQNNSSWYTWDSSAPASPANPLAPSAWHASGSQFYYSSVADYMPELNLANPLVTQQIYAAARFWLVDAGADGLRVDALNRLVEDGDLKEYTPATHAWLRQFYHYVRTINPGALLLGNAHSVAYKSSPFAGDQVDLLYDSDLASAVLYGLSEGDNGRLTLAMSRALRLYEPGQFLLNLTDIRQYRAAELLKAGPNAAFAAATLLLTGPAVPGLTFGDEIGMTGYAMLDVLTTPMQWDGTSGTGGFTNGIPWDALGERYQANNAASQQGDPDSLLSHYQKLLSLRQSSPALRVGEFYPVQSSSRAVYSYLRSYGNEHLLVVVNLSRTPTSSYQLSLPEGPLQGTSQLEMLVGSGSPFAPVIHGAGGFTNYVPLPALPGHGSAVIRLSK